MLERSFSLKNTLPLRYRRRNANNIDTLQQWIRDARRAGRDPDALPVARHLHRIVVNAGLQFLHHSRNRQTAHARRAKQLLFDAMRRLQQIQPEITRAAI